jgi:YD repeat-containing protein
MFIGILLCTNISNATDQNIPKIIPPSPEAASLGIYGDIPVSMYTGVPNISIPIYQIKSRDIVVPISISYHASGIKINQESSSVGLGWALNSGGVVTRTIVNKNDFEVQSHYFDTSVPELLFDTDKIFVTSFLQGGCDFEYKNENGIDQTIDFTGSIIRDYIYQHDLEPDLFNYNFNGRSGKFLFKRNKEIVHNDKENIKIEFTDATYESVIIKTPDGFEYNFDEYETYTSTADPIPVKTAWYLTRIISPLGEVVSFHYNIDNSYTSPSGSIYMQKTIFGDVQNCNLPGPVNQITGNKMYKNVVLDYIDWTLGRMVFDYQQDRIDLQNGKRLNKISIYRKDVNGVVDSQVFKEFDFIQTYFTGGGDNDIDAQDPNSNLLAKRMKLDEIVEIGGLEDKSYKFEYEDTQNMLCKNSFARDHWGYYNAGGANTSLIPTFKGIVPFPYMHYKEITGANRESTENQAKIYTLKKIIYPTGGHTEFEFELNDYDIAGSKIRDSSFEAQGSVDLNSETIYMVNDTFDNIYTDTLDLTNAYVRPDGFVLVEVTGIFMCFVDCDQVNANYRDVYFELWDSSNNRQSEVDYKAEWCDTVPSPTCLYTNTYLLKNEKYVWKSYRSSSVTNIGEIRAEYTYDYEQDNSNNPTKQGGGLRISKMINHDGISTDNDIIRKYVYNYIADENQDGIDEEHSYGRLMSKPHYYWYEYDVWDEDGGTINITYIKDCYRMLGASESTVTSMYSASGGIVGYDTVIVLNGKGLLNNYGTYGKSIHAFENLPDSIYDYGYNRVKGLPNLASPNNGQEKWSAQYAYQNGAFVKVSEKHNYYERTNEEVVYGIKQVPITISHSGAMYTDCDMNLYIYPVLISGWNRLVKTTETMYDQTSPTKSIMTSQDIYYDNTAHKLPTRSVTSNSKGEKTTQYTLYPDDYSDNTGFIGTMKTNYMINKPIEETVVLEKEDGNKILQGSKINYYTNDTISAIEKVRIFDSKVTDINSYQFSNQSSTNQLPFENPNGTFSEGAGFSERVKMIYGTNGELVEVRKDESMIISYIWGYNKTLPIAKIDGLGYDEVKQALGGSITLTDGKLTSGQQTTLRNIPNTLVTIYDFDPLIGITEQTDPNGILSKFEYDELGRLIVIKDENDDIVKHFDYHYKEQ